MAGALQHGWPGSVFLLVVVVLCCCSRQFTLQAQSAVTDMVYGLCNTASFTSDSTFAIILNQVHGAVMGSLQSSVLLYQSMSISVSSSNVSDMYVMYQCRGDLSPAQCRDCVSAIFDSAPCGRTTGMRILLQGCYLRFENYNFLVDPEITLVRNNCSSYTYNRTISSSSRSGQLYSANLAAALKLTAQEAPSHSRFWAATRGSGQTAAYALAQCVGYISPSRCASCLSQFSGFCNDSLAGEVYFVTCYYLFSNTPLVLFNASSTAAAPKASLSPSAPSPANTLALSSAPSPPPTALLLNQLKKKTSSTSLPVVMGSTVAGVLILAAAVAAAVLLRPTRRIRSQVIVGTQSKSWSLPYHFQQGATKFTFDELRQATSDFDPRYKLGEGGFGPVYKGRLPSGQEVAVKMLSAESHQGASQFLSEVKLINTVQHRNLIRLLGCCIEGSQRLLVYEYLPNCSLDLFIFGSDPPRRLDWRTRFEIIVGVARGLSYLHEDSHIKIVHRDIKASNILLDSNFSPKIADFGLARFLSDDVTHVVTTVAGTRGYVAPEYALGGQLTERADVYSFGVLMLEIVSGRRIIDLTLPSEKQHLLEWAWVLFERRKHGKLLDWKIGKSGIENADQVVRVVHVALLCIQTVPNVRPTMSEVGCMLLGESELLTLPSKPTVPGFEVYSAPSSTHHHPAAI